MAYKQKYYKNIEANGHNWRLEIWQDTENNIVPNEIGPVLQGLRIVVQGSQADVDTPIVKTSLEMSFIDAPGLEYERKCGYWEEFYTASATEYLVKLYKDGGLEWSGYITPDSFEEDLRYRGSVSVIARDNLGYLQDFMFTMYREDGLVTIIDLLTEATKIVGFAMGINGAYLFPKFADDNRDLRDVRFNISAFKDKNWWEVLESVFYSLGLTLRYVGGNAFVMSCIREQSKCGYTDYTNMPRKEARFLSYGHREVVPAAKAVVDKAQYEILETIVDIYAPEYQFEDEDSLTFVELDNGVKTAEYSMPVNGYASQGAGIASSEAGASRLLNPFAYKLKAGASGNQYKAIHSDNVLYALCNTIDVNTYEDERTGVISRDYSFKETHPVVFKSKIQKSGILDIKFTFERPIVLYKDGTLGEFIESQYGARLFLSAVGFKGKWVGADGTIQYLSQVQVGWSDKNPNFVVTIPSGADTIFTEPVIISLPSLSISGPGELTLEFYGGLFDSTVNRNNTDSQGAYIRITAVDIMTTSETAIQVADKTKVTTAYNKNNNLLIEREPAFAPNPNTPLAPQMIVNNILMPDNNLLVGAVEWSWGSGLEKLPLSALVHKQILCYHAQPMNLLSGELVDDENDARFDAIYVWDGKEHSLISGTLNVLTGRMEGAVLREFVRYENLWQESPARMRAFAMPTEQAEHNTTYGYEEKDSKLKSTSVGPDGSSYVTQTYADETYATKTLVSGVDTRLSGIEKYFSTSEDAGNQIDKWNEIVDFLNATEGTTLANILGAYASKDALAAVAGSKITISGIPVGLNGSITQAALRTGLGLDTILTWYDAIGRFFKKDAEGNIYLDSDFYTNGQFAAKIAGEEGAGGGGFAYLADLYDVDLSSLASDDLLTWNGTDWVNIKRSVLLSAYATKNELTNALIPYIKESVADGRYTSKNELATTLAGYATKGEIPSLDGYATEKFVTDKGYATEGFVTGQGYAKTTDVNETLKSYATNDALNGVSGRVTTLENAGFALASDVNTAIDGINAELANKATNDALNNGLNDRYTKKNVDDLFSNFKGTANITTLGTITSGVWNGSKIDNAYLANSKVTISGVDVYLGEEITQAALRTGLGLDDLIAWYNKVGVAFGKNADGTYFVDGDFLTNGQFAAAKAGTAGSGGGVMLLTSWPTTSGDYSGYALGGNLGVELNTRVRTLEGKEITWGEVKGKPNFATVATSGSYNDLSNKPTIPSEVTESTVSGWGFTKNTGTYSKPSGGIPKSDLASAVQTSLGKADTALQSYTEQYTGTITGITMNGVSKGTSGVVDLGTVITAHQDISGKADTKDLALVAFSGEYGELNGAPSALSQFTNDLGLGSLAYLNELTEELVENALKFSPFNAASFNKTNIKNTLGISDWALAATKPSYTKSDVGLGNVENKSSATIRGEITSDNVTSALRYTPYNATNPSGFITASALSDYLPLTGGVIESVLAAPLEINSTSQSEAGIAYRMGGTYKAWIGYNPYYGTILYNYASGAYFGLRDNGKAYVNDSEIYHTGNFNPSDYLPKSGGTISGLLTINDLSSANPFIYFQANGTTKAGVGYYSDYGTYIYNAASGTILGIKDDGTPHYNMSTIIHSGNIGSQSVNYANWLKSQKTTTLGSVDCNNVPNAVIWHYGGATISNHPREFTYGGVLTLKQEAGTLEGQFAWDVNHDSATPTKGLWFRASNNLGWGDDWKTIAFTDSNVSSAQSLVHSKGAVGATVTSGGNVLMGGVTDYGARLQVANVNEAVSQMTFTNNAMTAYLGVDDGGMFMYHGSTDKGIRFFTGYSERMKITGNGNVGIGMSNPEYPLDVVGEARVSSLRLNNSSFAGLFQNSAITTGGNSSDIWLQNSDGKVLIYGNSEIGLTAYVKAYSNMDIIGSLTAQSSITTNEITIGGIRIYAENGVLKIDGDLYTSGQFASGTIGN